jgi:glycyl-tRNA synthetase beta chain
MPEDLLLEIGVEELPASMVAAAVAAMPGLLEQKLRALRLGHAQIHATGTPRRLALLASAVADAQPDLDEQVIGPPTRVAFDEDGRPTKAALSFAAKLGCVLDALERVQTPKGEYLAGRRQQPGASSRELLPAALEQLCAQIPFRKSMRWSTGDTPFGRPVRWLVALLGATELRFCFAAVRSGRQSRGHRFLSPEPFELAHCSQYVDALRRAHVLVEIEERKRVMTERLHAAAAQVGGRLIEDEFLVEENVSLVEEPHVLVGSFDAAFLELPERVILVVAKEHQRYFGVRAESGALLPRYLAVVNTARQPQNVQRGNDRVMRARLADAKFFFDEDRKVPLERRRSELESVVFQQRLGSVAAKVARIERLLPTLGEAAGLAADTMRVARQGAALAKCDLVSLMVGELPELQGEMGRAYALAEGLDAAAASVIYEHYLPRGADDPTAPSDAGALVAIADRLDTLVGCFAVGLMPTGAADPLALRRAAIGLLRTLVDRQWDLSLLQATAAAYGGFEGVELDLGLSATQDKLAAFLSQRLRGVLVARYPQDAVDACLAADADRPHDVALRVQALAAIEPHVRASAGEVFKRAANIAKDAPDAAEPLAPAQVQQTVHTSEQQLFDAFAELEGRLQRARASARYDEALGAVASFAPVLGQFFDDVFVMVDDATLRDNRLRMMGKIGRTCSTLANFKLLAQ